MLNRREFVQSGMFVATLAAAAPVVSAVPSSLPIYKVVVDDRFEPARRFGAEATRRGATVLTVQGDVTSIWYSDFYHQWRKAPVAIAGLTAERALFCLDILARDVGMRVVYRGDHCLSECGTYYQHQFDGPADVVQEVADLGRTSRWATATASTLLAFPKNGIKPTAMRVGPALNVEGSSEEPLVSWIIAPIQRRV